MFICSIRIVCVDLILNVEFVRVDILLEYLNICKWKKDLLIVKGCIFNYVFLNISYY